MVKATVYALALATVMAFYAAAESPVESFEQSDSLDNWKRNTSNFCKLYKSSPACRYLRAEEASQEVEDFSNSEELTGKWSKRAKKAAKWGKKGAKAFCKVKPSHPACRFIKSEEAQELAEEFSEELTEEELQALAGKWSKRFKKWGKWAKKGGKAYCKLNPSYGPCRFIRAEGSEVEDVEELQASEELFDDLTEEELHELAGLSGKWSKRAKKVAKWGKKGSKAFCKLQPSHPVCRFIKSEVSEEDFEQLQVEELSLEEMETLADDLNSPFKKWSKKAVEAYCKLNPSKPACRFFATEGMPEEVLEELSADLAEEFTEQELEVLTGKWSKRFKKWAKKAGKAYCKLHPEKSACRLLEAEGQDVEDVEELALEEIAEDFTEEELQALAGKWSKRFKKWGKWAKKAGKAYCKLNPNKSACRFLKAEDGSDELALESVELTEEDMQALAGKWSKRFKKWGKWAKKGGKAYCKINPSYGPCRFLRAEGSEVEDVEDVEELQALEEYRKNDRYARFCKKFTFHPRCRTKIY